MRDRGDEPRRERVRHLHEDDRDVPRAGFESLGFGRADADESMRAPRDELGGVTRDLTEIAVAVALLELQAFALPPAEIGERALEHVDAVGLDLPRGAGKEADARDARRLRPDRAGGDRRAAHGDEP